MFCAKRQIFQTKIVERSDRNIERRITNSRLIPKIENSLIEFKSSCIENEQEKQTTKQPTSGFTEVADLSTTTNSNRLPMSPPPPYTIQEQQGPHQTQPEKPELQQQKQQHKLNNSLIIKNKPKLAKCMSIVHLFGNAYSTQQYASCHKDNDMTTNGMGRLPTIGRELNNKSKLERFKHRSENQIDGKSDAANLYNDTDDASSTTPATITITTTTKPLPIEDFCDDKDLGARAFRTISKVNHIKPFTIWLLWCFFFLSISFDRNNFIDVRCVWMLLRLMGLVNDLIRIEVITIELHLNLSHFFSMLFFIATRHDLAAIE